MWIIYLLLGPIIIYPLCWLLNWRIGKTLTGTNLENHCFQAQRWNKLSVPLWLFLILAVGQQLVDLHPLSREHRAFWLGFIVASYLFLMWFMVTNVISFWQQERDKRRQAQATKKISAA